MEKRPLGKTGLQITALGLGSAEIGFENVSQENASKLLNAALDAGLNLIDTAECYLASEDLIGNAVAHRRKDFYLFSKCGHAAGINLPDWDPKLLEQSIDRSLRRLKTDHLDLIQLHSCSLEQLQTGDVLAPLVSARALGKTRFIGYSGDDQAARYAVDSGVFDTLQTSVSIADQQAIELTIPAAQRRGMGVIAKRPIANAVWRHATRPANSYVHSYWDRIQALQYNFLGWPQSFATALRFTLSIPGVTTAIVGTSNPARWQQNADLLKAGPLPRQEFDAIRARWKQVAKPEWIGQT